MVQQAHQHQHEAVVDGCKVPKVARAMPLEVERAAPPSPPPKAVSVDDSAPSPQRAASSAGRSPGTPERHYSDSTTPGSTAPVLPGLMVSMPSAGFERQAVSKAKFVSYDVLVQVDGHRWVVHRRYTDFCALADGIRHLPRPRSSSTSRPSVGRIARRRTAVPRPGATRR